MFRSDRLYIVIGVFLAIVVFVGFYFYTNKVAGEQQAAAAAGQVQVVVASGDMPAHSLIKPEMLKMQTVDQRSVTPDNLIDPGQAIGRSNTTALMAGQRVLASALGDPDFSLAVRKGKRAMAIAVDDLSGVAGLVNAGDYVDVVVSVKEPVDGNRNPANGAQVAEIPATKAIIQDVQVIKIAQMAAAVDPTKQNSADQAAANAAAQGQISSNIIVLAVSDQEAELIKYSRENGEVHLVLRAKDDHDKQETLGASGKLLMEKFGVPVP
jgi:pilus assembly protein CpaB